jgi:adenylate cyclase
MEGDPRGLAFFDLMETHRVRNWVRLMRRLPADPRCRICRAPFGGFGGRILRHMGFSPSRKNPHVCSSCFEHIPEGGIQMDIGVLFADVRGFTTLSEEKPAGEVAAMLNRFFGAAVDIICEHGIVDKFVGDQVMALYIPRLVGSDDVGQLMVDDAREILAAAGDEIGVGIGIDLGSAYVGNVGSGEVKDFTAIGDVVNTAARLQGVAAAGEIVLTPRVVPDVPGAERRTLELKGKSAPVDALVVTP